MFFGLFRRAATPFNTGYLPTEDGHDVYFAEYGNATGIPILRFHGGPGWHAKEKHTHVFNLKKHRVILFDQRGCGQSRPAGMTENNTLEKLVKDAKRLLDQLSIHKCTVYGGSWGATLALAFAQAYPAHVERLVLTQVFLARQKDIAWITEDIARCYPDIIHKLKEEVRDGSSLRAYYAAQMASGDRVRATQLYGSYERMIGQMSPCFTDEVPTQEHISAFGIYMHYDSIGYGLYENQLMANIGKIAHLPTLIVHNRLDLVCPVDQAWELHRAMPNSNLVIVPDSGHGSDMLDRTIRQEISQFI